MVEKVQRSVSRVYLRRTVCQPAATLPAIVGKESREHVTPLEYKIIKCCHFERDAQDKDTGGRNSVAAGQSAVQKKGKNWQHIAVKIVCTAKTEKVAVLNNEFAAASFKFQHVCQSVTYQYQKFPVPGIFPLFCGIGTSIGIFYRKKSLN